MQYGELLDDEYNENRDIVYKAMTIFYNNPLMIKFKNNENNYGVYMCKLKCMLNDENRYLFVIVKNDNNNIGSKESMINLPWVSLQTRKLKEDYNIEEYDYIAKNVKPLDSKIKLVNRNNNESSYICENLGLNITLLHEKNELYEYNNSGNVLTALETFSTIITFI